MELLRHFGEESGAARQSVARGCTAKSEAREQRKRYLLGILQARIQKRDQFPPNFLGEELLRSRLERSVCCLHSRMSGKHKSACSLSLLSHLSLFYRCDHDVFCSNTPAATLLQHTKSLS
jgi:hypothetical protein